MNAARSQQLEDCVFCGIVAGNDPASVVYEDAHAMAFLDIAPATDGHTIVVPKRHADDLLSVNPDDLAALATATQIVARLLDDRLKPDGLTVFQANRAAGWQDVFHLHFHVVPRWKSDPLRLPWTSAPPSPERIATIAALLAVPHRSDSSR